MENYRSPNYTNDSIFVLQGDEQIKNEMMKICVNDFWRWAYSDLIRNTKRGVFAEFLIKMSLEYNGCYQEAPIRLEFEPFDLLGPCKKSNGERSKLEIKSASLIQSWEHHEGKKPSTLRFSIAPAKVPDKTGDYPRNAERQRNSDIYIFSIYNSSERGLNILDVNYWEFYICPTYIFERDFKESKTISIDKLKMISEVKHCSIEKIYKEISDICITI